MEVIDLYWKRLESVNKRRYYLWIGIDVVKIGYNKKNINRKWSMKEVRFLSIGAQNSALY